MFVAITSADGGYTASLGGSVVRTTTQDDRSAFGLFNDGIVKDAVNNLWGKAPDSVFYNDPTDWSDQTYAIYGWQPVTLTLQPVSWVAGQFTPNDYTLVVRETDNSTSAPISTKYTDSIQVENTQTTTWLNTSKLTVSEKIGITLGFFGSDTSVSFEQDWQQGGSSSNKTTLGSQVEYDLEIPAETKQTITMLGGTGQGSITVTYNGVLSGYVFCNYSSPYALPGRDDKHHFYAMPVAWVLQQQNLPNPVQVQQQISLSSYKWTKTTFVNTPLSTKALAVAADEEANVLAVAKVDTIMSAS